MRKNMKILPPPPLRSLSQYPLLLHLSMPEWRHGKFSSFFLPLFSKIIFLTRSNVQIFSLYLSCFFLFLFFLLNLFIFISGHWPQGVKLMSWYMFRVYVSNCTRYFSLIHSWVFDLQFLCLFLFFLFTLIASMNFSYFILFLGWMVEAANWVFIFYF